MGRETSDDAQKRRVRQQFAGTGSAYVTSGLHAAGDDLPRMRTVAQPQRTDHVLDIATGGGHVALAFAPRVASVVATDLTPEMLDRAAAFIQSKGVTNVTFQVADAEALPFADDQFNIVTCRIAPHHFPHPDRFVHEVARVLAPGGRFVLIDSTVPAGPVGRRFNEFERLRDPSHVRSLTDQEWLHLLQTNGLTVQAIEHFPRRHDFADWTQRADVPEADLTALAQRLLDAPPAVQSAFKVERQGDRLIAFTDIKTLFLATAARPN